MLTTPDLVCHLLTLGFVRHAQVPGLLVREALQVELLDAPRLRVQAPSGLYYLAVGSATQLAHAVADIAAGRGQQRGWPGFHNGQVTLRP